MDSCLLTILGATCSYLVYLEVEYIQFIYIAALYMLYTYIALCYTLYILIYIAALSLKPGAANNRG